MIHPSAIHKFTASGTGDMGDVTKIEEGPRVSLPGAESYCLAYFRARFTGGTGTGADLTLRISHHTRGNYVHATLGVGSDFDFGPIVFEDCGTDDIANVEFRVPDDELRHYRLDRCPMTQVIDEWCPTWANPDSGNMKWAIEFGLIDAKDIPFQV